MVGFRQYNDEQKTTLPVRLLNAEFKCPVCLGILHDTLVVQEVSYLGLGAARDLPRRHECVLFHVQGVGDV